MTRVLRLEHAPSKAPILVFCAQDIARMMDAGILYALSAADEKHHPGAVAMKDGVPVYESLMIDELEDRAEPVLIPTPAAQGGGG